MLTGIEQRIIVFNIVCEWLIGQLLQLVHLAKQTVHFRNLQHATGQTQPRLNALDARQLLCQIFWLLLVTVQTQRDSFIRQQTWQPTAQLCSALTIATGRATIHGPAALHQPARRVQGELAPARVFEFFEELLGRGFAHVFVVLTDLHQRAQSSSSASSEARKVLVDWRGAA